MKVKPNHPLAELLAKLLHGVEVVNAPERRRMANRACREATKWHKEQVEKFEWWVYDMEKHLLATNGTCPECGHRIASAGHAGDCDVLLLAIRLRQKMKETREKNNEDSIS